MAESKKQIIKAAIDEFYEAGYEGARVDSIAKRSGLNKAMIYYHFKGKENLYKEVLKTIVAALEGRIKPRASANESIPKKLKSLIDSYVSVFIENPKYPKILVSEIAAGAHNLKDIFKQKLAPLNLILQSIFKEGVSKGELKDANYEYAMLPIIAPFIVFFLGRPLFEIILGREYDDSTIEEYKEFVFNAIYYGIKAR